jgi:hypothetical protein
MKPFEYLAANCWTGKFCLSGMSKKKYFFGHIVLSFLIDIVFLFTIKVNKKNFAKLYEQLVTVLKTMHPNALCVHTMFALYCFVDVHSYTLEGYISRKNNRLKLCQLFFKSIKSNITCLQEAVFRKMKS